MIKTYYIINNQHVPKITFEQTNNKYIFDTILNKTNFQQIPNADVVILGIVHHLVNDFQGNRDFKWVIQNIENKRVMYLGCEFSIWGDIAGKLAELLIKYKNANTIIYIGKLGTLNKNIKPNITLATGNISYLNGKIIKWNNIFDNLNSNKYNVYYGKHYTLPSVIQETKIWFNKNKNKYNFVDP